MFKFIKQVNKKAVNQIISPDAKVKIKKFEGQTKHDVKQPKCLEAVSLMQIPLDLGKMTGYFDVNCNVKQ